MSRLLIVSNRLPVTVKTERGAVEVVPSSGGLATGLKGPHQKSNGLWVGWPGDVSRLDPPQRQKLERDLAALKTVPIYLSQSEATRFYEGFSNGLLWPLFHYLLDRLPEDAPYWDVYRQVNQRFADLVAQHYQDGDSIWVQDYQLMLVPRMLRERLPRAKIGFFLHIPFPAADVFRILPWRRQVLEGLLGADLIGFHTLSYLRHFADSLLEVLALESDVDRVQAGGREVRLGAFPMGIDAALFDRLGSDPGVLADVEQVRKGAQGQHLVLGIDRLDYTKGIPRRLLAVERLLEREPGLRGKLKLVQLSVPSRTKVDAYREFRSHVDELIGRINGAFGTVNSVPIHYLYRSFPERQVAALYRSTDVMLVTPLRDGMNLVAKEFVAARSDGDGVLVLSEFAGAASELGDALLVNPFDIDGVAQAIKLAVTMPEEERRRRMLSLRHSVKKNDVHRWAEGFLETLEASGERQRAFTHAATPPGDVERLAADLAKAPRLVLVLDYDGTLVPYAATPEGAAPDPDVRTLLADLAREQGFSVHVLSGRAPGVLERWLGELPVGLHAEHGFWSRLGPHEPWRNLYDVPTDWKEKVLPLLEQAASRTPGAIVEDKSTALAWHYRGAERSFGALQARELRLHLADLLKNLPVEVVLDHKVVEVRLHGVHPGSVLGTIFGPSGAPPPGTRICAMGDSRSGAQLFTALPEGSLAIHVGPKPTSAPFRLEDPPAARAFLRSLVDLRSRR